MTKYELQNKFVEILQMSVKKWRGGGGQVNFYISKLVETLELRWQNGLTPILLWKIALEL